MDEIILAAEIDSTYSPEQRHSIYLNRAHFGEEQTGIVATSNHYFHKTPDQVTLAEAALLTGLLQHPSALSPYTHPDRAMARRNLVLANMQQQGSITAEAAMKAQAAPLFAPQ